MREKPDIVHTNNSLGINFFSIVAAKICRIPCVAHIRAFERMYTSQKIANLLVNRIITISNSVHDSIEGISKEHAETIYDGLTADELNWLPRLSEFRSKQFIDEGRRYIGYVGMLNEWKGVDVFIRSFPAILRACPDVVGIIFGNEIDPEGNYKQHLQDLVKEYGLEKNITFAGLKRDIREVYAILDVVVHASLRPEPFGRVIIEAMAAARPIVATNMGEPKELIRNRETGVLYEAGDHDKLASSIVELLKDKELANRIGADARRYAVENFRVANTVNDTIRVYEEVVASKDCRSIFRSAAPISVNTSKDDQ